jgi:FkbM family methyltransferase
MTFYRFDKFSGRNSFSKDVVRRFLEENSQYKVFDAIEVQVKTLDQVIEEYCEGKCPDLLSIDCEGLDYGILAAFSFKTLPIIICVETGEYSREIDELLTTKGYNKLLSMGANGIYVR